MKIYRSNYGLPLGRWDRLINYLFERDSWLLYPLEFIEKIYFQIRKFKPYEKK